MPAAGLVFGVDGLAKQYLVAVRGGGPHHSFVEHPAGDRAFLGQIGFDVRPLAAGFEDDDFASAIHFREFRGTGVGREIDLSNAHHGAALVVGSGSRGTVRASRLPMIRNALNKVAPPLLETAVIPSESPSQRSAVEDPIPDQLAGVLRLRASHSEVWLAQVTASSFLSSAPPASPLRHFRR